jgi:beta-barrel assembly-enhancing protease
MKRRVAFLIFSIGISIISIIAILLFGTPENKTDFNSIAQVGENLLNSISRTGKMITKVSDEEEIEIGDKIHERLLKRSVAKNIEGTPIQEYLNEVGNLVSGNVKRKNIPYKFHIIDSRVPNAFASCGGHIYISIGLLERLKTEAELAAIIGHEITHVDAKHSIGRIQHKVKHGRVDNYLNFGVDTIFQRGYSETQEDEADIGGVYLAYKAGYHPLAVINAFERMKGYEKSRGGSLTPVGDTLDATFGLIGRYFGTHPLSGERIDKIRKYIDENGFLDNNARLYVGKRNFAERQALARQKYAEEYMNEYVVEDAEEDIQIVDTEELLKVVYTIYGTISDGMGKEEIKELLPKNKIAFENENRVGYKNIYVYQKQIDNIKEMFGLWIELEKGKVSGIKLYRQTE